MDFKKNDRERDKVRVNFGSGNYFVAKKDNLWKKDVNGIKEEINDKQIDSDSYLYLNKQRQNKHHKDTEQYITSAYYFGAECSYAFDQIEERNITKTKNSICKEIFFTNPNPNYQDRRESVSTLKKGTEICIEKDGKRRVVPYNMFYFPIQNTTKHFTSMIANHGSEKRCFTTGELSRDAVKGITEDHMDRIKDEDFQKLLSCYIKSGACHGAYHDEMTTIFDEIQKKLKRCKGNVPKCFVSLVKKDYSLVYKNYCDEEGKICGVKRMPVSKDPNKIVDYEELCKDKDKYFDYYYVTKDAIYKVPHELVHNRVRLIDEREFDSRFKKLSTRNIDINADYGEGDFLLHKVNPNIEFKEFYDYKKKKEQEKSGNLNNLNTGQTVIKK